MEKKKELPEIAEDIRVELQGIRVLLGKLVLLMDEEKDDRKLRRQKAW